MYDKKCIINDEVQVFATERYGEIGKVKKIYEKIHHYFLQFFISYQQYKRTDKKLAGVF